MTLLNFNNLFVPPIKIFTYFGYDSINYIEILYDN